MTRNRARIPAAQVRRGDRIRIRGRFEGGGTSPTLPLLRALATALDAALDVSIDTDDTQVAFVPHAGLISQGSSARRSVRRRWRGGPRSSRKAVEQGVALSLGGQ